MNRISTCARRARIVSPALVAFSCLLLLIGCGKSDAEDSDDAPIASEAEAHQVQLQFDGVFRNESRVYNKDLITELELHDEGLQQRRDGYVVFDAPCSKEVRSKRRVDFLCVTGEGQITLWPLEFSPDGELFHRAMPEMLYQRVAPEVPQLPHASDVPTPSDVNETP